MIERLASDNLGKLRLAHENSPIDWLRCDSPTDEEKSFLAGLGVDEDLLNDTLDPHEVPRLEFSGDWVYFIIRVPDVSGELLDFTTPVLFALNSQMVVTVGRDDSSQLWRPFIDKTVIATGLRRRLFLTMIDFIAQSYQDQVTHINRQTRALTDNISEINSREIASLVQHERKLNDYLDALIPTNVSLEKLLGKNGLKFQEDDLDEIEDLSIDLEQVIARSKSLLRTIQNVRDSYRAVMDTRLNETMRTLTIATVMLTIPTMLAGLLGMNVKLPFDIDSGLTFWYIVGIGLVAAIAVSYYFKKR